MLGKKISQSRIDADFLVGLGMNRNMRSYTGESFDIENPDGHMILSYWNKNGGLRVTQMKLIGYTWCPFGEDYEFYYKKPFRDFLIKNRYIDAR